MIKNYFSFFIDIAGASGVFLAFIPPVVVLCFLAAWHEGCSRRR